MSSQMIQSRQSHPREPRMANINLKQAKLYGANLEYFRVL